MPSGATGRRAGRVKTAGRAAGSVPSPAGPALDPDHVEVRSREAIAATMVVLRDPGEVFLLRHTAGPDAVSWVERVDPITLETLARSDDLPGGPTWPGGMAAHANGSLHVVFGNHAHRLAPDLTVLASRELPRRLPYNSFVVVPDGHLVTKDFGGVLPGQDPGGARRNRPSCSRSIPRRSRSSRGARSPSRRSRGCRPTATPCTWSARRRCSACIGTATTSCSTRAFAGRYRTIPGQTYGWDAVLALGAAWFLDNGEGSERYAGTFRGQGISSAPLHLVRVDLATAAVDPDRDLRPAERPGREPAGRRRGPPDRRRLRQRQRRARRVRHRRRRQHPLRWRREQNHACHPLLFADTGELVTNDHDATAHGRRDRGARHRDRRRARAGRRRQRGAIGALPRRPDSAATSTTARSAFAQVPTRNRRRGGGLWEVGKQTTRSAVVRGRGGRGRPRAKRGPGGLPKSSRLFGALAPGPKGGGLVPSDSNASPVKRCGPWPTPIKRFETSRS